MARRLVAKVGEYEKQGEKKGEYVKIGVIMNSSDGEYVLLDPTVNLAGILIKQRLLSPRKRGDMVMVSVFDDDRQQQNTGRGGGQPRSQYRDNQQQQGGQQPQGQGQGNFDDFDDDIPF